MKGEEYCKCGRKKYRRSYTVCDRCYLKQREQKDGELEMGLVKELYFEMKERGLNLTLEQYMEMKNNEKDNDNRSRGNR